jgi:hypothetical protein
MDYGVEGRNSKLGSVCLDSSLHKDVHNSPHTYTVMEKDNHFQEDEGGHSEDVTIHFHYEVINP